MQKLNSQKKRQQQKVIGAAIQIFAEKGFAYTSTNEIAAEAGVSRATILGIMEQRSFTSLLILPFLKEFASYMAEELFEIKFARK
ncbi:helix-turn-helix transcriptional regulator [Bacillus sp. CRN 9]|nr:helix-turn-helix transcriptional regulator [Bacillus sp. CRN 9]